MLERYYRELLNYFTRSVNDRDTAADVVQEAYTRVLGLQHGGGVVREPRALLFHAGRNIVVSRARRQAAEQRMLETLALVSLDQMPSLEREAIARQQLERLMQRLAVMPHKRRDVFILVRVHGYSYAEAAAHMGVSSAAIEKQVVRAILDCAGYAPDLD